MFLIKHGRPRRSAVVALGVAATTLLAACSSSSGGSGASATSGNGSASGAASSGSTGGNASLPEFAFDSANTGNGFFIASKCAMIAAAKAKNLKVKYYGSTPYAPQAQLPVLNAIAATNPKVLIVPPTDGKALDAPLTQLKNSGTKIVSYDSASTNPALYDVYVHSDEAQAGRDGGEAIAKAIGNKGTVLMIDLIAGNPLVEARTGGVREALSKYPGIKLLPTQYDGETATKDTQIVNATLAAHPDLKAVVAMYSEATDGVVAALKQNNKLSSVKVEGWDGEPNLYDEVRNGTLVALVVSPAQEVVATAVDKAIDLARGKTVSPKVIVLRMPVVTKANIDDPTIAAQEYKTCSGA